MNILVIKKHESYSEMSAKLMEEYQECQEAITSHQVYGNPVTRDLLASEVLDVIQVAIGVLDRLTTDGLKLDNALIDHSTKLRSRGWEFKQMLELRIKDE